MLLGIESETGITRKHVPNFDAAEIIIQAFVFERYVVRGESKTGITRMCV